MSMNIGLTNIIGALDFNLGAIILITVMLGTLVFYAHSFTLGVIMSFVASGLCFLITYGLNITFDSSINYGYSLVLFLIFLILMAFTLYMNKSGGGNNPLL